MHKIILPLISCILFACSPHGGENLLADGGFEESAKMWDIGKSELTSEAHAGKFAYALYVETPRYIPVWSDICIQKIKVIPGKEYRLSAFARMSLPPLTNGVYIGVRRTDGSVLKDRLFLLFGRDWTRMALDFDSGKEQELIVFCGVWTDRNSTYFVDDFSLNMIK